MVLFSRSQRKALSCLPTIVYLMSNVIAKHPDNGRYDSRAIDTPKDLQRRAVVSVKVNRVTGEVPAVLLFSSFGTSSNELTEDHPGHSCMH